MWTSYKGGYEEGEYSKFFLRWLQPEQSRSQTRNFRSSWRLQTQASQNVGEAGFSIKFEVGGW